MYDIPDVRDGLTRQERVVLYVLDQAQKERGDRNVPTAMLWGRVGSTSGTMMITFHRFV